MPAPRVFVEPERLGGERARLEGVAHRHLVKVLRVRPGDEVVIFDGAGVEIDARVAAVGARTVELTLGARRRVASDGPKISLLVGIPKGERMEYLLQKTAELGVAHIAPLTTARTVARPPAGRAGRWRAIVAEAARQCGRADVPTIADIETLPRALAALPPPEAGERRLVPWEEDPDPPLAHALDGGERHVVLLVGPEGGFAADEIDAARAARFVPVGLGPRVLRVDTAAIVAVALTQAALGGLGGR